MFFKFPYTDLYTLNLDWMIKYLEETKANLEQWKEIVDGLGTIVHSVNGQTGDVQLGTLVNSVNGQTGAVQLGTLVNSINGKTGAVEIDNDDINALKIEVVLQSTDAAETFTPAVVRPLFSSGIRFIIINDKEFYSISEDGSKTLFNPFKDQNLMTAQDHAPTQQEAETYFNQGVRFVQSTVSDVKRLWTLEKIGSNILAYDLNETNGANLFNEIDASESILDYSAATLQEIYKSGQRILFQDTTNGIRKFYALLGNEIDGYTGYIEYDPVNYFDTQFVPSLQSDINDLKSAISTDDNITWNQLSSVFTRASGTLAGVTYTKSTDGKQATFNGTASTTNFFQLIQSGLDTSVIGHKYAIYTPRISGESSGYWFFYLYNRNVRDTGGGAIWEATEAVNIVVGIEWNTASKLPTFNNLTVNLPIITDLTTCFGAGNEPTIEEFRAMFPNDSYPKDAGTQRKLTRVEKNALDIFHNTAVLDGIKSNIKLKILSFNCGHYNYGAGSEYSGDDMQEKIVEWKQMLAKYKPDIMLGQEMSIFFDNAQTVNAIDQIFKPLLPNFYYGNYTKLLSKFKFIKTWQETIMVTVSGTTYTRAFTCASINVGGVEIVLCSIHLPSGYSAGDTAIREAMRDAVINAFSNYPYVIIGGDFNESTDSFFAPFVTAGYTIGNHGYFGTIATLPNESVDNIVVKGFTFYDAVSNSADACTSDHYPFASDIHIA